MISTVNYVKGNGNAVNELNIKLIIIQQSKSVSSIKVERENNKRNRFRAPVPHLLLIWGTGLEHLFLFFFAYNFVITVIQRN